MSKGSSRRDKKIEKAIRAFENDPTFFLRHHPELHKALLKIAKTRKPDDWVGGMPVWIISKLIKKQVALAPHGLLFISSEVDKKDWEKIAKHEKLEVKLVKKGCTPEKAHRIASKATNNKKIEKAIKFLVLAIEKSGHNPKSVITHSIRVGLHLDELNYSQEIVIAGILHDLLEDSETKPKEIKQKFGDKVAGLVKANSFDKNIKDKKKRYQQTLTRCLKAGKEALIIKTADILDNSHYYHLAKGKKLRQWLVEKMKHFIDHSEKILKNEAILQKLQKQYCQIAKEI